MIPWYTMYFITFIIGAAVGAMIPWRRVNPLFVVALFIVIPWVMPSYADAESVPAAVDAGVAFPIQYSAEARDGSGPITGASISWAVGVCDDTDCTSAPNVVWCATKAPTTCVGTAPTWFTMLNEDSLGTTYGLYLDFFKAPTAVAGKYLQFFIRDGAGSTSTNGIHIPATTLVNPSIRVEATTDVGPTGQKLSDIKTDIEFLGGN